MAHEDFRKLNMAFRCENCGKHVAPARKTSRNHCPFCLYSKHVDIIPGDRKEVCQGLMEVIDYELHHGEVRLIHKCQKCGKVGVNKSSDDDHIEQLLQASAGSSQG